MYHYKTKGTCSSQIDLTIDDQGIITACAFTNGCSGNTQGLAKMVVGQRAADVRDKLKGIQCRSGTSCPDQLARAIDSYPKEK